jgi:hypothetical protein
MAAAGNRDSSLRQGGELTRNSDGPLGRGEPWGAVVIFRG